VQTEYDTTGVESDRDVVVWVRIGGDDDDTTFVDLHVLRGGDDGGGDVLQVVFHDEETMTYFWLVVY